MNRRNLLSARLLVISSLCWIAPAGIASSVEIGADPRPYLESLIKDRASIRFLHVAWSVSILKNSKFKQLEKCHHEFEGWYDFEIGARRVNERVDCPNAQELNSVPRFAFDGEVYRVILGDHFVGYELHSFDKQYMRDEKSRVFDQSTDVRLLGLYPVPYSVLKNFSINDLWSYVNGPKTLQFVGKQQIEIDGFVSPDLSAFVEIDPESGMPSRIETKLASVGQRRELQCTWKKHFDRAQTSSIWFPATVRTRTWEDGVTLSDEEIVELKSVEFGEPPPNRLYEWKSLAPVDKFVVEFRQANKRVKVEQWDAKSAKFVSWNPKPLTVSDPKDIGGDAVSTPRRWLIAGNIVLIVVIAAWIVMSRLR